MDQRILTLLARADVLHRKCQFLIPFRILPFRRAGFIQTDNDVAVAFVNALPFDVLRQALGIVLAQEQRHCCRRCHQCQLTRKQVLHIASAHVVIFAQVGEHPLHTPQLSGDALQYSVFFHTFQQVVDKGRLYQSYICISLFYLMILKIDIRILNAALQQITFQIRLLYSRGIQSDV